jgi:two-component system NarL family sensor kinase
LSALIWQINALRPAITADRLPALHKLTSNAQAIARDVRALITHLERDPQASPSNTGIEARLRALLAGGAGGLSWQFEYELGEQSLEPGVEALVYRIARALVANVYEHAQARQATLSVTGSREHIWILVRDDGIGFDPARLAAGSTGLVEVDRHARAFAGGLRIVSTPGEGSEVSCWLTHFPIDEQQPKPGNRSMPE